MWRRRFRNCRYFGWTPRSPRARYSGSRRPIWAETTEPVQIPLSQAANIAGILRFRRNMKLIVCAPAHPHRSKLSKEVPMLDKNPAAPKVNVPNDLAAHWMPFTANRAFKKAPRLLAGAKGMHYITVDGRHIIDAAAGMWCCNAGHGRAEIASAIGKQAEALDYAPPFQF